MIRTVVFFLLLSCLCCADCFCRKVKTVSGEFEYQVPENVDVETAKQIAFEKLQKKLIAEEFGMFVSEKNSIKTISKNGDEEYDFVSVGESELKGEWIETIGEPEYNIRSVDNRIFVSVSAKGKIREIVEASIEFKATVLRNGTDDKFQSLSFKNGDDMFLSFITPTPGYVVVYLIDNDNKANCLLPYFNQGRGNVAVKADKRYVFFSRKKATEGLRGCVEEYSLTAEGPNELNQLYVVFSSNPFVKAVDNATNEILPRQLDKKEFLKWLSSNRLKDDKMIFRKFDISISE